jgi:Ca-activated chloride channel family protein
VIDIDNIATDRDLVFTYQSKERNPVASLAIEQRETALNADEKFYLVQLTPPSLESSLRPEREIVLCLDTSGSMEGLALDGLKRAVSKILERLGADNGKVSVGVLGFNDSQKILSPLMPLTEVEPLLKSIQGLCAGGGTQAGAAIEAALTMFGPRGERQVERSIVFITDGDSSAYEYRNTGRADVRIHGVGISSAIDHHVLKAVCERTGGSTYWVHPGEDYDVVAREVVSRTNGPIVKDVSVEGLNPTVQVIGGRELWNGEVQTLVFRDSAPIPESIVVRGTYMNGNTFTQTIECSDSVDTRLAVSKVWTREQLRGDISPAVGTQLSLEYGVLSRWTSFVAVQEKAVPGAQPERVDIPVHMPHGWEMEVGGIRGSFLSASGPMMLEAACGDAAVYSLCADSLDCDSGMFFGSFADFGLIEEDVGQADAAIHPTEPLLLSEVNRFLAGIQQAPFSQDFSEKWKEILTTLEAQAELGFADWSEAQKAELYLALGTARGYGFTTAIPQELRERPRTDAAAVEHWRAAQRALGIHPQP